MASDRQQFARAMRKWEMLRANEQYSVDSGTGALAILYSMWRFARSQKEHAAEREVFIDEAQQIASQARSVGNRAFVLAGINPQTLFGVIHDPSVTDIVLIGHGDFSAVHSDSGHIIDWRGVSDMTTHLKRGVFIQRFCGLYMRQANVPFGTFAVDDHRNVLAPAGEVFIPDQQPESEKSLQPVTKLPRLAYDDVKLLFTDPHAVDLDSSYDTPRTPSTS